MSKDLKKLLTKIAEERQTIAIEIIYELEYLRDKVLKDLKAEIDAKGVVDYYGKTLRESPLVKSYNQSLKNFGSLFKQLESMMNVGEKPDGENALQAWLKARK